MEHDEKCASERMYCRCEVAAVRADERRRVLNTVATLRASSKKDENGWALYEHCYECRGAADGYDTAIDDALRAICVDGEHKGVGVQAAPGAQRGRGSDDNLNPSRNSGGDIPASPNTGKTPDVKDGA